MRAHDEAASVEVQIDPSTGLAIVGRVEPDRDFAARIAGGHVEVLCSGEERRDRKLSLPCIDLASKLVCSHLVPSGRGGC